MQIIKSERNIGHYRERTFNEQYSHTAKVTSHYRERNKTNQVAEPENAQAKKAKTGGKCADHQAHQQGCQRGFAIYNR